MFCPECGYKNDDENKFCRECGTKLPQQTAPVSENIATKVVMPTYSESFSGSAVVRSNTEKRKKIILWGSIIGGVILIALVFFFIVGVMSEGVKRNDLQDHIVSGGAHTVVVNDDGTVTPYIVERMMENPRGLMLIDGQDDVYDWRDITSVATCRGDTIGVKKDGTVVATNSSLAELISKWDNISSVSASYSNIAGLKRDGTVVTTNEELDVSGWKDIIDISTRDNSILGLKGDGTVVYAVAVNEVQKPRLDNLTEILSEWKDIVDIENRDDASMTFPSIIAVRKDGTIATAIFSDKDSNWHSLDSYSDWKGIVSISTGDAGCVGLKKDGTVITTNEELDVSDWKDIVAVSSGNDYIAGLKKDGTLVSTEPLIEYDKEAVDKIINDFESD